ncbi:thioredoxin [Porcincola intestinalis]|jgi:thioredoxin 1|uniref:thioredoxin n=1 Tax=Porcincola intestinalis TaxID=2606632 RepID=UPI0023F1E053|nr:thioredoxin [Porcincola intestinalis]MCI6767713.1 thioredoxin [Lachnospiraceae bacterium]MDD7060425.1 thioredoxin [Porcincola intestinalis]MDY4204656.1 thioredoxin [Porcincola intestinalis]MDY5282445.1 thioredoxin [Porcincola intestinalis]MDY5579394.1 thioredoxin [Porcincola intestinalis]
MSVKVINSEDFANAVKDGVSVVDFNATWCGPCKMLGPVLEKLSDEITDVKFYAMDVDENPDIAEKFGIMSIPYVAVFRDGVKVDQNVGFIPEASMRSFIEKNK